MADSLSPASSAIHFGVRLIGPFVEGSGVVRCPDVTQNLQDKRCETRARTAPSIGDDGGLRREPLRPQEGRELGGGLQRPAVRIKELGVLQLVGPR